MNSKREKVLFQIVFFLVLLIEIFHSLFLFLFVFCCCFFSILLDVSFDQKCARMSFSMGTSPPADVECEWA